MPRRRGGRQRRFRAPVEGRVESLSPQGLGIIPPDPNAQHQRSIALVGALPGEQVRATLHERRGSMDLALLDEVEASHPQRISPPCAHFLNCSGCVLQHLEPAAQVAHKEGLLRSWADEAELRVVRWAPPVLGPTTGYRRKARLAVRWVEKKGRALVGFRELRDGRFVADIQECTNLHPAFKGMIAAVSELVASLSIAAKVAQVEIAAGDDAAGLVLRVLEAPSEEDLKALKAFAQAHTWQIWLQPGGMDTIADLEGQRLAEQEPKLSYRLDGGRLELKFGPDNFVQVNREVNEQMIERAMEWLDPQAEDVVLDLFCGLGNFTLPLGLRAKRVIGAESDPALLARARSNAQLNGLGDLVFVQQDLYSPEPLTVLERFNANKVLLDPPRSGAGPVVDALINSEVNRIVYVACGPTAMVEELKTLQDAGFQIASLGILDMFPHTAHFESIALLTRDKPSL